MALSAPRRSRNSPEATARLPTLACAFARVSSQRPAPKRRLQSRVTDTLPKLINPPPSLIHWVARFPQCLVHPLQAGFDHRPVAAGSNLAAPQKGLSPVADPPLPP